ncbi:MAG: hypothetical protein R3B45_12265 [Bdellovibrionota bacterium]
MIRCCMDTKKRKYYPILFIGALYFIAACGSEDTSHSTIKEAPDYRNASARLGVEVKQLDKISKHGRLKILGWSGNYWPTYKGGIANRWQENNFGNSYHDYLYDVLTLEEVNRLDQEALNKLSPAEKYDLYLGNKDFPITKREKRAVRNAVNSNGIVPYWFGLCHGWAPAAIFENAGPGNSVEVVSRDNHKLKFYASDLKALMVRVYADANTGSYFLGGRCNDSTLERDLNGRPIKSECRDANPASLHMVLDHYISRLKMGFVADIVIDSEVWNQPIVGYDFTYSNYRDLADDPSYRHAAAGTKRLVDVDLQMEYLQESSPSRELVNPLTSSTHLQYTLELDKNDYIIGGEWLSRQHPDFLWQMRRKPDRAGDSSLDYSVIQELWKKSHRI